VVSPFDTVTDTAADVLVFPAASRAIAARLCTPLVADVVVHDAVNGALVTCAPRLAPSNWYCTPVTPTLSVALTARPTVPDTVAPATGVVIATVGGVVSAAGAMVTVTVGDVPRLPAASRATAVSAWLPLAAPEVFHDTEYGAFVSSAPRLTPSS